MLLSAVWLRYTTTVLRKYFNYTIEQKHGGCSMIIHESMYHNMRIHVIFLPPYFLPCPNFIRPHTINFWVGLVQLDLKNCLPLKLYINKSWLGLYWFALLHCFALSYSIALLYYFRCCITSRYGIVHGVVALFCDIQRIAITFGVAIWREADVKYYGVSWQTLHVRRDALQIKKYFRNLVI